MWNNVKKYFFSMRNSVEEKSLLQEENKLEERNISEDKGIPEEKSISIEIIPEKVNNIVEEIIEQHRTFTSETPMTNPLIKLQNEIKGKGREEYPLLDKTYALNSRVPCADFSGFIKERLLENDVDSVIKLMDGILCGSFQWDNENSWIEKPIRELLKYDFEKYIIYEDKKAIYDLLSLWIIAFKSGGGASFWITTSENYPKYFTIIMSCYAFQLTENFPELITRANKFIEEMRKVSSYWDTVPLYKELNVSGNKLPSELFCKKFNSLSSGGKITLHQALFSKSDNYNYLSRHSGRSIGVNILDVLKEITESEILIIEEDSEDVSLIGFVNKKELEMLLISHNISYKKSWNKEKMYDAVVESDYNIIKNFVNEIKKEKKFIKYQINQKFKDDADIFLKWIESVRPIYDVLLFVNGTMKKIGI